jgi:hypothetical protein
VNARGNARLLGYFDLRCDQESANAKRDKNKFIVSREFSYDRFQFSNRLRAE